MKAPSAACASADGAFAVTKDKKNPGPRADRGSKAGCRPGQPAQGTIFRMGFEACARPSDWRRARRRAQASRGSSAERHAALLENAKQRGNKDAEGGQNHGQHGDSECFCTRLQDGTRPRAWAGSRTKASSAGARARDVQGARLDLDRRRARLRGRCPGFAEKGAHHPHGALCGPHARALHEGIS